MNMTAYIDPYVTHMDQKGYQQCEVPSLPLFALAVLELIHKVKDEPQRMTFLKNKSVKDMSEGCLLGRATCYGQSDTKRTSKQ